MIVIFRAYSVSAGGDPFALFPEVPASADGKLCAGYNHFDQTGAEDYNFIMAHSRPANPNETVSLLAELRQIGYVDLTIRKRATAQMHLKRRAAAKVYSKS
jgi:hypothetical protein